MNTLVARITFTIAVSTLLASIGCETHTCRSACSRIFEECAYSPSGCETKADGIDCNNPDEVATYFRDDCIDRCEEAMYNIDLTEGNTALYNEEDAAQFVECVVDTPCTEFQKSYPCNVSLF